MTYLRGVIVVAGAMLMVLPLAADAVLAATQRVASDAGPCRVVRVIDGDTVDLWCATGLARARLTGFDTPELFSPQCAEEAARALAAKWALRGILLVAGEVSFVREGTDRYERVLVAVVVDGVPLARRMVTAGHARPYGGESRQGWCDV